MELFKNLKKVRSNYLLLNNDSLKSLQDLIFLKTYQMYYIHYFISCLQSIIKNWREGKYSPLIGTDTKFQNDFFFFCLFAISRATPTAYRGSQARGRIWAVAAHLRQSHSNVGSELRLQPTPQLTAMLDP